MSKDPPPGQDQAEIQGLVMLVAENLQKGEDPDSIAQQLIDNGWEKDEAYGFVASIQQQMQQPRQESGEWGWLIWIGALVGINLASYLFGWGFFIW